jgi:uncharacterized protein (TIGR03118 family)
LFTLVKLSLPSGVRPLLERAPGGNRVGRFSSVGVRRVHVSRAARARQAWKEASAMIPRKLRSAFAVASAAAGVLLITSPNARAAFQQTNLTSDGGAPAAHTDPNLVNPWGMSFLPGGPFWISDQVTGKATVYDSTGAPFPAGSPIVVSIPSSAGADVGPTGQAANTTSDFALNTGGKTGPALFLFANLDGSISAWNQTGDASKAVKVVNPVAGSPSAYTGLALASSGGKNFLYAANDAAGKVDVFDKDFKKVTLAGNFTDPGVPKGLAPFNIVSHKDKLIVTWAVPGEEADAVDLGSGAVSIFNTDGTLDQTFAIGGQLASPWGVAVAPASFGEFANAILVGNFNDEHGIINAFDANSGLFLGTLRDRDGKVIANGDLWALSFGNDGIAGSSDTLFFTAGIGDETHGLFGSITPAPASAIPLPMAVFTAPLAAGIGWFSTRRRRGSRAEA